MALEFWWPGKTSMKYLQPGLEDYENRLRFFYKFQIREFNPIKNRRESVDDLMLKNLDSRDILVLLDERGQQYTSKQLASFLEQQLNKVTRHLVFVAGGPYGFSPSMYARSNFLVSLSAMTFPHDIVRLIFLEQLYRACAILSNLPYHHD